MDPDFIRELFSPFRDVAMKRMFGGAGLYADGLMFGLVFDGVIYLRVDAASIADFEREGSAPFVYPLMKRRPGSASQHFWRLPDRLYDDPHELATWAGRALAIAESRKSAPRGQAQKPQANSRSAPMFLHRPVLQTEVNVRNPDPVFAEKLLEQFGGATGELTAALTYWTQSFHTDNAGIRDMLQDIGTEEFAHLEVIAMLIEQHTRRASQGVQDRAYRSTLFAVRGPGPQPGRFKRILLGRAT